MFALLSGAMLARAQSLATLHEGSLSPDSRGGPALPGELTTSAVSANARPEAPAQHRFFDSENRALFAAVAALSAADFAVTRANLRPGGRELNPITRLFGSSTAGLAVNFVGETAVIVGLSYYFHRTRHHQLERFTTLLNIGASSFAVGYDLSRR